MSSEALSTSSTARSAQIADRSPDDGDVGAVGDVLDRWLRPLVGLVAGLAALSYAWGISRDPLEPYYAASVRSMTVSWRNFFFGSFDPAGTITLDKLPGAFWVQALSVRIFGFHTWSMVLPQAVEGAVTVVILYRAVERLKGPVTGLVSAVVLAASPATVALNRGNISDTAMILLLVLAANSVSAAISSGRQRHIVVAGVWVALAFQTKMIEAWVVLPAFGAAYLFAGPGELGRKARHLIVGGAVAAVLSLAWMSVVTAIPGSSRPYVDGSHHDSVYEQVFDYNGFGRFGQQTPLQLLAGQDLNLGLVSSPSPSWDRLFQGELGRDTGWLLPAALLVGVGGLLTRRRGFYVLWTGWLVTMILVFSVSSTINAYYTAALSPPIAALLGAGTAGLWVRRRDIRIRDIRSIPSWLLAASVVLVGTVGYGLWLAETAPAPAPSWVWPVTGAACAAALILVGASTGQRQLAPVSLAIPLGVAAILFIPSVASAQLVARNGGAFDTPFQSKETAAATDQLFVQTPRFVASTITGLRRVQLGARYLLATQTAAVASVFITASGDEALPIGGFTGTIPEPTLTQIKADIRSGRFHLVLAAPSRDARLAWIETHCREVGKPVGSLHTYFCTKADA